MGQDDRIAELEMALAHQERLCDELNEVVLGQAGRLDALERRMAALLDRLSALDADGPAAPPADVRPPHW
jgi:SlyX protein